MFAVTGALGNVGFATSSALRQAGVPVRAIVRDAAKAGRLREMGCEVVVADLQDSASLVRAIGDADAVQVIVPVHPEASDPAADLRYSCERIVAALREVRPKRALLISDYGAHVAADIGMPTLFREMEAGFLGLESHTLILRSAEHMHNWARIIPVALASGTLPSFQDPVDRLQPTIAAQDLGSISAGLLRRPDVSDGVEIVHAEGPRRYSASDVAAALSELSGRTIRAHAVPRAQWQDAFAQLPASLAGLLIKANDAKNQGGLVEVEPGAREVIHGTTELIDALRSLVPPE